MKQSTIIATASVLALIMLAGCGSLGKLEKAGYPLNYTELANYFVRNDVAADKPQRLIINSREMFESYFGESAVMGRGGQPTPIDFNTQYVLAIVLAETDRDTEVIPGEVVQNDRAVFVNYRVRRGAKAGYRMVPFAAIAIDKPASDTQMEFYFKQVN